MDKNTKHTYNVLDEINKIRQERMNRNKDRAVLLEKMYPTVGVSSNLKTW
jgi:hypothetical protein